jgi:predicted nucleotidyltransferase
MTIDPRLRRIVAAQPYPLLFATISGAHLYGFPSPDSDFDLRGAHILPVEKVVGLGVSDETVQQEMIVEPDGGLPNGNTGLESPVNPQAGMPALHPFAARLEMDIVSHDVRKFFGLLLKKNGYVLEQLYSPLIVHTTPEHEELKAVCNPRHFAGSNVCAKKARPHPGPLPRGEGEIVSASGQVQGGVGESSRAGLSRSLLTSAATGVITRHHAHHYLGFAETQWKLFLKESPRRVKPLLYVYRVLLTGIHLMRTGEVEANLVRLDESFKLPYIADLVARKLAGPENLAVGQLLDSEIAFHESEYQRLRVELQAAHDASQLQEVPSAQTRRALNDLLVRVRLGSK